MKLKLKRDDTVRIVTGKDRGKTGKVLKIDAEKGRVIVQGLNMVHKAVKPRRQNDKGGIIDVEASIDISNVMVVCKKCGPTRVGYTGEKKNKTRICRKCGEAL